MHQHSLNTSRLLLRPFTQDDAAEVNALAGNINVAKTTLNVPHPYSEDMARSWISTHQPDLDAGIKIVYAITLSDSGTLVGTIGLHDIKPPQAEMGYWVGEPYWGNGYCTEAATALIEHAFTAMDLSRIHSEHLVSNPASGRVMQKAGMRHYASSQCHDRYGDLVDIELYEIMRFEPVLP